MRSKSILALLFFVVITFFSYTQTITPSMKEREIVYPVKNYKEIHYDANEKFGRLEKGKPTYIHYCQFDERNNVKLVKIDKYLKGNQNTISFDYYKNGKLKERKFTANEDPEVVRKVEYEDNISWETEKTEGNLSAVIKREYDSFGNVKRLEFYDRNNDLHFTFDYTYNSKNQKTIETINYLIISGSKDSTRKTVKDFVYDNYSNVIKISSKTMNFYKGKMDTEPIITWREFRYKYNEFGNWISKTEYYKNEFSSYTEREYNYE